jgi:hypothetical protein
MLNREMKIFLTLKFGTYISGVLNLGTFHFYFITQAVLVHRQTTEETTIEQKGKNEIHL